MGVRSEPDPDFLRIKRNISDPGAFAMIVLHTPSMVSAGIVAIWRFPFRLSLADRFSRNRRRLSNRPHRGGRHGGIGREGSGTRPFRGGTTGVPLVDGTNHPAGGLAALAGSEPRRYRRLYTGFRHVGRETSAVRYIADLGFRFKSEDIRTLLSEMRIPRRDDLETRSGIAGLPIRRVSLLWDDPNPWRTAWAKRKSSRAWCP